MISYYSYCHPNRRKCQNRDLVRVGEEETPIPMTSTSKEANSDGSKAKDEQREFVKQISV